MRVQFVILLMRMFFVCTEKLSVLLAIHSNLTHNQIPKARTTIVLVVAKLLVTIKTLPKPQASSPRESGSFFFWQLWRVTKLKVTVGSATGSWRTHYNRLVVHYSLPSSYSTMFWPMTSLVSAQPEMAETFSVSYHAIIPVNDTVAKILVYRADSRNIYSNFATAD